MDDDDNTNNAACRVIAPDRRTVWRREGWSSDQTANACKRYSNNENSEGPTRKDRVRPAQKPCRPMGRLHGDRWHAALGTSIKNWS
jgi:hypothetical protein